MSESENYFFAEAYSEAEALTNTKAVVTASATASASSDISTEDAYNKAFVLAQTSAQLTATYDANLISQAVDIGQDIKNYNTTQIDSPPDIIFYYCGSVNYCTINKVTLGTSVYESFLGDTYSDISLTQKFGTWSVNGVISDVNNVDTDGKYATTCTYAFYLPQGTLVVISTIECVKGPEGYYVIQPGTYLFQIASGSGDYLNKSGILSITYNDVTLTRIVSVYLN